MSKNDTQLEGQKSLQSLNHSYIIHYTRSV
jgi:hypothetical protein